MTNNKNLTEIQESINNELERVLKINKLEIVLNMVPEIARLSGLDELPKAEKYLEFLEDEEALSKKKEEVKEFIKNVEDYKEKNKPIERISFLIDAALKGIDSLKEEYDITLPDGLQNSLDNRLEDFSKEPSDSIKRNTLLTTIVDVSSYLKKAIFNTLNPKKEETNVE